MNMQRIDRLIMEIGSSVGHGQTRMGQGQRIYMYFIYLFIFLNLELRENLKFYKKFKGINVIV
jgi:hypothetical protein